MQIVPTFFYAFWDLYRRFSENYTENMEVKRMENYLDGVKAWWEETADSEWYQSLRTEEVVQRILTQPESAFPAEVYDLLKRFMEGFEGKRVLVPSSGDNHAAFAFSALGAQVISADISERQLENARKIAEKHGLHMNFVQADTMTLEPFADGAFDLVYTSNGVHSWINELEKMYENISRVLKSGGMSVMWDIHPFQRPFAGEVFAQPRVVKAYDDVKPQEHNHWRVMDLVNSTVRGGLCIEEMLELNGGTAFWYRYDETPDVRAADWHDNPLAALPTHICIAARK